MITLRKQHGVFGRGTFEFLPIRNRAVLAFARTYQRETIFSIHNLSSRPQRIQPRLRRWQGSRVHDLMAQRKLASISDKPYTFNLHPMNIAGFN